MSFLAMLEKDIDKNKVRQSFALAAKSYDGLATLQRKVGLDFIAKMNLKAWQKNQQIADIGCGTGFIAQQLLLSYGVKDVIAIDIAFAMLEISREKLHGFTGVNYLCADVEALPLSANSLNHMVSNLALQWCQELDSVFSDFKQVLKNEGTLSFSTFGPGTLKELKSAWSQADDFQHVNTFYSAAELTGFLQRAEFKNIKVESKSYQSKYLTVIELMRELKGIGAHNVLLGRNKKITSRAAMQKMISVYENKSENSGIVATYEIFFVTASVVK